MEKYCSWVGGGNCKHHFANAQGFPGVNPTGWPLIKCIMCKMVKLLDCDCDPFTCQCIGFL